MQDIHPEGTGASLSQTAMSDTGAQKKYIMHQVAKYTKEHTQREKENSEEIKNISKLISAMEETNASNQKLSRRMFWLAMATVTLATIQIVVAIIGLLR